MYSASITAFWIAETAPNTIPSTEFSGSTLKVVVLPTLLQPGELKTITVNAFGKKNW